MIHLRRRTDEQLDRLLARSRSEALTYGPAGISLEGAELTGFTRRRWETPLPAGSFDRAVQALHGWAVHRGAGLRVRAAGPIAVGTDVAISAPLPLGHVDVACRIVAVVDEPGRVGFAYGTLPVHPSQGEECFIVHREPARFVVEAVSRSAHPLARLVPPVATRLQASATARYLAAMRTAVG